MSTSHYSLKSGILLDFELHGCLYNAYLLYTFYIMVRVVCAGDGDGEGDGSDEGSGDGNVDGSGDGDGSADGNSDCDDDSDGDGDG